MKTDSPRPPRIIPIAVEPSPLVEGAARIHARAVGGRFNRWRWALVLLTQCVFYGLPWLRWNNRPAVWFDLEAQRFFWFEWVLYPHDLIYLAVLLVICALGLFLVTAVAGRVWCGFSCPQTVYTWVFTQIEKAFEGDRSARIRLDASALSWNKVWRKTGTQTTWGLLAVWTGLTFVGYFTPIRALVASILQWQTGPWEAFWIAFYALATYGNAGYLRENMCKHICPYGRFQSVMFDRDTWIIAYDRTRGETRGPRPKGANAQALGLGDCIDCTLCIQVCPTGIDIRNGLQSNCIGCAACIDACDSVMDKIQRPRGLIRYSSLNGLAQGWTQRMMFQRLLRPRVWIYAGLLTALVMIFVLSLEQRPPVRLDVIRDRSVLARVVEQGTVENLYRLHLLNATERQQTYRITLNGPAGTTLESAPDVTLPGASERSVSVTVRMRSEQATRWTGQVIPIDFTVETIGTETPRHQVAEKSTFWIPDRL